MAKDDPQFPTSSDGTVPQELVTVADRVADAHYDIFPDAVASCTGTAGYFLFRCKNGLSLEVRWQTESMIRFRYAPDGQFDRDFSYAVDPAFQADAHVAISMEDSPGAYILRSTHLQCHVEKKDLRVHLADAAGNWICRESRGFFARKTILRGTIRVAIAKERPADEASYGLGDKGGALNLRGRAFDNWCTDAFCFGPETDPLYKSIPFFYGLRENRAYGIFLDNTYRSRFDFGKTSPKETVWEAEGGEMRYYFIYGPALLDVGRQYATLTGKPELPPIWALGFHQSRWSYFPDSRVREVAKTFRDKQIPCDAIYLDIDYMDGFRCFTWDREHFPNLKGLIRELRELDVHTVVMIDPGIKIDPDYSIYRDGLENDVFCRRTDGELMTGPVWPDECVFPDFTDPKVRKWWGPLYRQLYLDEGVAGFWNDMNEPAVFKITRLTFPDEVRHDYDGRPTNHRKAHNIYGQQMARATRKGLKQLDSQRRPFVLTRASFAGGQRHAATWTGDNAATWEHLQLAHTQVQRLSISGFGFCGSDIGGFDGEPDAELMLRWLQMGVFHLFFRIHSIGNNISGAAGVDPEWVHEQEAFNRLDQEPWAFGTEWEQLNRQAIEWRYQWLPYLYTAFWQWTQDGTPPLKNLVFLDQEDPQLRDYSKGASVGPDLLVFPVWKPGQKEKKVYLPKGEWADYWTGAPFTGGARHRIALHLDRIPLFVRAGAILPQHPVRQSTARQAEELILRCYPGGPVRHEALLYEDAGEGYGYLKGEKALLHLEGWEESGIYHLRGRVEGNYPLPYRRLRIALPGLPNRDDLLIDPFPIQGTDQSFELAFELAK